MVREDLDEFVSSPADLRVGLEQPPERLVQSGPLGLRQGGVGHVADQDVTEAVGARPRPPVRRDDATSHERVQGVAELAAGALTSPATCSSSNSSPMMLAAWSTAFSACVRASSRAAMSAWIDSGTRTSTLSAIGGAPAVAVADEAALLDQHPHEFLAEERIARRTRDDLGAQRLGQIVDVEEPGDQCPGLVGGERFEHDRRRVRDARSPGRIAFEQFGPGDADDEKRHVDDMLEQTADDLEDGVVGPLQVVDHDDDAARTAAIRFEIRSETEREFRRPSHGAHVGQGSRPPRRGRGAR